MHDDYKKRIEHAVCGYIERNNPTPKNTTSRKNLKPEKDTERECLSWMRQMNWDVAIYESKATYNPHAGRWIGSAMKAGTADCMGTTDQGVAVFVEFKAKGKLSTFAREKNYRQQDFLISKIEHGAFACVVDSAEALHTVYYEWAETKSQSLELAKQYLLKRLPKKSR